MLLEIEARRVDLWKSKKVCTLERLPVVVPCTRGMYVLIEALLDSPKVRNFAILQFCKNSQSIS